MQFREFIEQDTLPSLLGPFVLQVKSYVLNSLHVVNSQINLSFPSNFENYFGGAEEQTPFMRLAAHAVHSGQDFMEAPNQEHPLGKGGLAFNAIADSPWAKSLKGREPYNFQRGLKSNLRLIAKEMGLIFELNLFIYIATKKRAKVIGDYSLAKATAIAEQYQEVMLKKVGPNLSGHLKGFLAHHADELAEKVFEKASKLLKCNVDYIKFLGGNILGTSPTGHRVTADFVLGCSKLKSGRNELGFTTKFTSETQVRVADLWFKQAYVYLGGRAPGKFEHELEQVDGESRKSWLLDIYENLAAELIQKPQQVNWLFNKIILGTEDSNGPGSSERIADVYPAFRNYVRNTGSADFSDALRADFNVTDRQGMKLAVKSESSITSRRTGAAVLITVKTPDGTPSGTSLKFDVDIDRVVVKMNNLTSK